MRDERESAREGEKGTINELRDGGENVLDETEIEVDVAAEEIQRNLDIIIQHWSSVTIGIVPTAIFVVFLLTYFKCSLFRRSVRSVARTVIFPSQCKSAGDFDDVNGRTMIAHIEIGRSEIMSQIAIILLFLCQQTAFSFGAECSDDRDDCEDAFYICGVYANYEKKCSKTCELCPAQQDDAIRKCVSKNHKDFCYKLESVCSSMLGVPLPSFAPGSSHKLPPNVAHCVSSENRMAVCHVKHGSDFCYKLEAACARINNVPLPQQTPGSEYKLPEQVAACMSKEEVMAVCEAKHGAVQCNSWKESCTKKRKGAHELSGEEKECIKTQSVMATCKSKYGDHCLSLQGECAGIYGVPAALLTKNGIYKMASIVESCVDLGMVITFSGFPVCF
ncbi:unnamed protein product [Toxocara canis]|uniref:ShKT domain-containing protein n=1 Tax=Toxocara canis TaxID=6265 RepID=A0A183UE87_TOXCA|nr:unnamed protein product [Toxocara canis]